MVDMHQDIEMKSGEELVIRDPQTNQVIGVVRRTFGGFYRAYSYMCGSGWGPIFSEAEARDWVHKNNKPVFNYSRSWRRG